MNFLNKMSDRWNISLFHYRNHGADFGRVLIGIQVLPQDKDEFMHFLDDLGYEFDDESNNPAYQFSLPDFLPASPPRLRASCSWQ